MLAGTRSRWMIAFVGLAIGLGRTTGAWAAGDPPTPPPTPALTSAPSWRRVAFPAALAGTGLSLAAAIGFKILTNHRADEFNNHQPLCLAQAPDKGGPGCADLLTGADSAQRWSNIGLGATVAFGVTAIVLKLTEPAAPKSSAPILACAPGLGFSASCRLTF